MAKEKFDNIMFDLETMGTAPGCPVLQIGACEFGPSGINPNNQFYVSISLKECVNIGMTMDPSTVLWWMTQSDEARKHIVEGEKTPIITALTGFTKAYRWKGKKVWCNGASFDFPIITEMFRINDLPTPWDFWNQMDMRTIKNFMPSKTRDSIDVKAAVAHNALYDALSQAENLIRYCELLNLPL